MLMRDKRTFSSLLMGQRLYSLQTLPQLKIWLSKAHFHIVVYVAHFGLWWCLIS